MNHEYPPSGSPSPEITPDPENARNHPPENEALIRASIQELGAGRSILIDGKGRIIAGNETFRQAEKLGLPVRIIESDGRELIAIRRGDLDRRAAVRLGILDNQASDLSEFSAESLLQLAKKYGEETVTDGIFTEAQWRAIIRENQKDLKPKEIKDTEGTEPGPGLVEKWGVVRGQLWKLGDHRVLCGDSTEKTQVDLVLDGQRADMVFTDPPYGISYQGKGGASIAGDVTYAVIPVMFAMMKERVMKDQSWLYICGGQVNVSLYAKMIEYHFNTIPRIIVWDKQAMIMRHNGYHSAYEFVYYANTNGAGNVWYGDRAGEAATDIWRIPKPNQSERTHLTEKPVDLPARAIRNSCPIGGIVWEPFAGTGSTVLACEKEHRAARAVEWNPEYFATILERWNQATGETPALIEQITMPDLLKEGNDD